MRESPAESSAEAEHMARPHWLVAIVLLVCLLYLIAPGLSPLWVLAGLLMACAPHRGERWATRLMVVATALFLVWAIGRLQHVLAPFAAALIVAYILDPLVDALTKIKIPRAIAAVLLLMLSAAAGLLAIALIVPPVVAGASALLSGASDLVSRGMEHVDGWLERLPSEETVAVGQRHLPQIAEWLQRSAGILVDGIGSLGRGVSTLGHVIGLTILTPVLIFYLLIDFDRIRERALDLVPGRHRGGLVDFLGELETLLAGYFRGQLIVSIIAGTITGVLLAVAGAPYALTLGVLTAILNMIPVVGFWVGFGLAILAVFLGAPPIWPTIGWVVLIYVGVQQIEGNLLSPRIVGKKVGLHPVAIMLALLGFGSLFGLVGVLIAVPLAGVIRIALGRLRERYLESDAYRAGTTEVSDSGETNDDTAPQES